MPLIPEKQAVVISPHQDDAVISLGQLLTESYSQRSVINIFTTSGSTVQTLTNVEAVTRMRCNEEETIGSDYHIMTSNGGFEDCEVRKIAWNDHLAPIDLGLYEKVSQWLYEELSTIEGNFDLFIPAAFGLHPDHYLALLTFTVEKLRSLAQKQGNTLYLYAEQPYFNEGTGHHQGHSLLQAMKATTCPVNPEVKSRLLSYYPSQLSPERVRSLATTSFEYCWEVSPGQLSEFLQASLKRNEVGLFTNFMSEEWLDKVEAHYRSYDRRFLPVTVHAANGTEIKVPLVLDTMIVPDLGRCTFARFAGVYVSDYFSLAPDFDLNAYLQLKSQATSAGADVIWFSNIREDTQIAQAIQAQPPHPARSLLPNVPTVGLYCHLSFEQWKAGKSKNMRRNIKRKFEKLDDYAHQLGESVCFDVKPAAAPTLTTLLANQASRAGSRGLAVFNQNREFSRFILSLEDYSEAFVGELKIGHHPLSSLLFFTDSKAKTLAFYMQSFESAWADYSPSFCAITKLIEYAHEQDFLYIDFLRGEEEYKQHFIDNHINLIKFVEVVNEGISPAAILRFISSYEE